MKMKIKNYIFPAALAFMALLSGCTPDESGSGNGLDAGTLDASFTAEPTAESPNTIRVQGSTAGMTHWWNGVRGTDAKEFFYPLAGTYEVSHKICGIGGEGCVETTQTVTVANDDPSAYNRIEGAGFETAEDIAKWTTFPANVNGAEWVFENGKATFHGSQNWAIQNLYQTIEVEPGDYMFDMTVSGQGSNETYMEWYAGYNAPVAGSDYTEGGQILALNTWAGCATSPFEGQLSVVGCGDTLHGIKHFATAGTVYVVLRTASGQSGANPFSITIDNVEVRRIN